MRRLLLLIFGFIVTVSAQAQLTANGTPAPCASMTSYTNSMPNDPIYYYQAGQLGSLTATPPGGTAGWTFAWSKYNPGTSSWVTLITQNNLPTSTMNNLQPGAYRVTITDGTGTVVGCFRAWVLQILQEPLVTVNPITGDCDGPITLSATITNPQVMPYHNLPPDPMLINASTAITVCFSAQHTYVSDLAFHLRGPAQCGNPDILLAASPGICNGGDNLNNFCFTKAPSPNFNVCTAPTPLTGSYDSYGAGSTAINWNPLNGCDATAPGWRVELWDCVGGDQGTMTMGSVSFTGTSVCGQAQTVSYQSPAGFSAPIAVVSCSTTLTAAYTVSNPTPPNINCTFGYQWTSNPPIVIPSATSSLNIPISTLTSPGGGTIPWQNIDFTLSLTSPCTALLNCLGPGKIDSESFILETEDETIINAPAAVCVSGSPITLTATPAAGTWSGTGITNATNGTFDPAIAGVGDVEIFFEPTDPCFNDTSIVFTVDDLPILVIDSPDGFCIDGATHQFTSPTPGGTWSGPGITAAGIFNPATAGLGVHTITYDVGGGCPVSTTKDVTVHDLPVVSAGADATICNGSATTLQASGAVSYSWAPTTGIPNPYIASPSATPPSDNFTYTVTGTDNNGCSNTDAVTLVFFDGPEVTASDDPEMICAGAATPVSAIGTTANGQPGAYMWTPSAGVIGASTANATVSPLQTTTYTVTFTDNCGLSATDQVVVTTEAYHSVNLPVTSQFCAGADVLLQAAVTGPSPSFAWTSTVPGFDGTNYTSSSLLVNQAGTYTLTVTSPMGCINADQTVVSEVPLPNPYLPSPVDLCPNLTVTLNAGTNWDEVHWSNGANTPSITVSQPGVYNVNITHNGCSNSGSVTVDLVEMPSVELGPDLQICDGTSTSFSIPVNGSWSTGANASTIQVSTGGTYYVTVNVGSCVASDTVRVQLKPRPVANLPIQVVGCLEGTVGINAENPVNASYLWSTGETTPLIEVSEFGTYTVVASNDCGSATDSTSAYFQDCTYAIYIPNTFTPDNDGINEIWQLSTYNIKKLTLRIFNRWGDAIYTSNEINPVWTGEVNEGEHYARDGVYTYHLKYETVLGELGERSGNIIILR